MEWNRHVQSEEHKDLCPDTSPMCHLVDTKCVKRGDNDEDGRPAVVEREGEVDEQFIAHRLGNMIFLDNIVDVLRRR